MTHPQLTYIKGVGPAYAETLTEKSYTVNTVASATPRGLSEALGVGPRISSAIIASAQEIVSALPEMQTAKLAQAESEAEVEATPAEKKTSDKPSKGKKDKTDKKKKKDKKADKKKKSGKKKRKGKKANGKKR